MQPDKMSRHRQFKLPRAPDNGAIQAHLHESTLPNTSTTSRTREEESQSFYEHGKPPRMQSVVNQDNNLSGQYIDPLVQQPVACNTMIPPDLFYPIQQYQTGVDQQSALSNYMSDHTISTEPEQYPNSNSIWEHDDLEQTLNGTQENLEQPILMNVVAKPITGRNDGGELSTTDKLHDVTELDKIPKQRQFKLPPAPNYQNRSPLLFNHQMVSDNGQLTSEADTGSQSHSPQRQNAVEPNKVSKHRQFKLPPAGNYSNKTQSNEASIIKNVSPGNENGPSSSDVTPYPPVASQQCNFPRVDDYEEVQEKFASSNWNTLVQSHSDSTCEDDFSRPILPDVTDSSTDYSQYINLPFPSYKNGANSAQLHSAASPESTSLFTEFFVVPKKGKSFSKISEESASHFQPICSHQNDFIQEDANQNVLQQADIDGIQNRVTEDGQTSSESPQVTESESDFVWEDDGSGTTVTAIPESFELQDLTDDEKNGGSIFIDKPQDVLVFNIVPEEVRLFNLPPSENFSSSEITEHIHNSSEFTSFENDGSRSISREEKTESNKNKEHRQFSLPRAPNYMNKGAEQQQSVGFLENSYVFSNLQRTDGDQNHSIQLENKYPMIVDKDFGFHNDQQDETGHATENDLIWINNVPGSTDKEGVPESSECQQFGPPPVENYADNTVLEHQHIKQHSSSAISIIISTSGDKDTSSIDQIELHQSFANPEVQCQSSFIPFENQNQLDVIQDSAKSTFELHPHQSSEHVNATNSDFILENSDWCPNNRTEVIEQGDIPIHIQPNQYIAQNCSGLDYQHRTTLLASEENFHRDNLVLKQTSENSVVYHKQSLSVTSENDNQVRDIPGLIFEEHHHQTTEQMPLVCSNSLWESNSLESLNGENETESSKTLECGQSLIPRAENFEKNLDLDDLHTSTLDNLLSALDNEQLSSDKPPSHCEPDDSQERLQKNLTSPQQTSDLDLENPDEISKLEKAMFSKLWARYSRRKRVLIPCSLTEKVPLPTVNAVPDSFKLQDPSEDSFDVALSRTCSKEDGLRTYHVTTEEVNRRINGVEKLNCSNFALTMRQQKSKSCGETIRKKMRDKGIDVDPNAKQNVSPNKILVMSEAEGVHLVMDLDDLVWGFYPADDIADEIVQEAMMDESVNLDRLMDVEAFSECMRSLRDALKSVVPPITGILPKAANNKCLNLVMEEFSEATHGLGIVTQPTWIYALTEIGKGVTTLIREELERSNEVNDKEGENCQAAE